MSGRRNPFDDLERALERMTEQLDRDFGDVGIGTTAGLAVDVEDRGDEFVVTTDLPGYDREEITVEVADDRLTVGAEREAEESESEGEYVRRERRRQSARRTVALPGAVDEDAASATYRNGVLTVTLPKQSGGGSGHTIDIE